MDKQKRNKHIQIFVILLIIGAMTFWYFTMVPQYYYIDHAGYKGGAIVLSGYFSWLLLINMIKRIIIAKGKSKYIYLGSIANFITTVFCIKSLLMYKANVYLVLLVILFMLLLAYFLYHEFISKKINAKIGYISYISFISIVLTIATLIRGCYIFIPTVGISLISIIVIGITYIKDDYYPYSFEEWKVNTKLKYWGRFKVSAVVLLSIAVLFFLLAPLELYVTNRLSFSFSYKVFLPILIVISLLFCILGSLIISLVTDKTHYLIVVFLAALSVLSYIQYMFMNTKMMEEDGSRLNLNTMGVYPKINQYVWIIGLLLFFIIIHFFIKKWNFILCAICGFISAVQIVAVVSLVITCINSPTPKYYQMSGKEQFTIASEKNVIVLIPDTFSRGRFNELLEWDPTGDYMETFKDFTYYDNVYSECFPTLAGLNHLLTGKKGIGSKKNGITEENIILQAEAWNSEETKQFFNLIKKNGYKFYMNMTSPYELLAQYDDVVGKIENIEYAESNVDIIKLTKMLVSMSCYSCLPYVLKPPFQYFSWDFAELEQYKGISSYYGNEDFFSELSKGITIDENVNKKIHLINWHGFHEEWTNDEFCNPAPKGTISRQRNSKGVMLCIDTYLEKLKEIGRYDDCTIIIMGDHGDINTHDACVFIKLSGETHDECIINHSKLVYDDFRATLLDIIGEPDYYHYGDSWIEQ